MKNAKLLITSCRNSVNMIAPAVTPVEAASPQTSIKSMSFTGIDAPKTINAMVKVYSNASLTLTYTDGASKSFPLSYKELYKTENQLINQSGENFVANILFM